MKGNRRREQFLLGENILFAILNFMCEEFSQNKLLEFFFKSTVLLHKFLFSKSSSLIMKNCEQEPH